MEYIHSFIGLHSIFLFGSEVGRRIKKHKRKWYACIKREKCMGMQALHDIIKWYILETGSSDGVRLLLVTSYPVCLP